MGTRRPLWNVYWKSFQCPLDHPFGLADDFDFILDVPTGGTVLYNLWNVYHIELVHTFF